MLAAQPRQQNRILATAAGMPISEPARAEKYSPARGIRLPDIASEPAYSEFAYARSATYSEFTMKVLRRAIVDAGGWRNEFAKFSNRST